MIYLKLFKEHTDTLTFKLRKSSNSLLSLYLEDELIGKSNFWVRDTLPTFRGKKGMYIHSLEISKKHLGKKYSNILMEKIIEYAKNNKFEVIYLEVRKDNPIAIHIYEKYGFEIIEELNRDYKHSYDMALVLSK